VKATLCWLALAAALLAGACSSDAPVSGELSVRLTTPHFGDRAILFSLSGRQHGVTAASGYRVFADTSAGGDTTHVVVVAAQGVGLAPGEIARIAVDDVRRAGSYAARVTDLAAANYGAADTAGVSLKVVKP
jgi:hypothetical protein